MSQLQSLTVTVPRRKRTKPKLKLKIINQNSVAVLQTPPDAQSEHSRDGEMDDSRGSSLLLACLVSRGIAVHVCIAYVPGRCYYTDTCMFYTECLMVITWTIVMSRYCPFVDLFMGHPSQRKLIFPQLATLEKRVAVLSNPWVTCALTEYNILCTHWVQVYFEALKFRANAVAKS